MPQVQKRQRRKRSELTEQIENKDRITPAKSEEYVGPDPKIITEDRLIPSGSTLVNCACSDNPKGAFALGTINTVVGKSQGGKTIAMLTMLACCAADKRFDNHELIFDDAEQTESFDMEYLFEPLANGRLLAPKYDDEIGMPSNTIQDFKANILLRCKSDKPFIYVLDSLDSLSSDEELEREYKTAIKKAKSVEEIKELKGSYKMEKAKGIGEALRMANGYIKKSDSALFIIQQTRQNTKGGFGSKDWTTSGGEAPFFYSFHQIYFSPINQITDEYMNLKHKIGSYTQIEIIKNKLTGKKRKSGIVVPIYEDYGEDDVGSCVDFLKKTGHWKSDSGGITAKEFDIKLTRDKLINHIEKENLEERLQEIVGDVWNTIEEEIRLNRKRKF